MRFSPVEILGIARPDGYDEGTLEKLLHLAHLLHALNLDPALKGQWVLRRGTALNLYRIHSVSRFMPVTSFR